jgi:hypothetical protein
MARPNPFEEVFSLLSSPERYKNRPAPHHRRQAKQHLWRQPNTDDQLPAQLPSQASLTAHAKVREARRRGGAQTRHVSSLSAVMYDDGVVSTSALKVRRGSECRLLAATPHELL